MDLSDVLMVRITVAVPISREAWRTIYGLSGPKAIRAAVKTYVETLACEQLRMAGVLAEGAS